MPPPFAIFVSFVQRLRHELAHENRVLSVSTLLEPRSRSRCEGEVEAIGCLRRWALSLCCDYRFCIFYTYFRRLHLLMEVLLIEPKVPYLFLLTGSQDSSPDAGTRRGDSFEADLIQLS